MSVADRLSADAMIEEAGQAVTLTRRASGSYDTATGTAAITETTQSGKGVIFDFGAGLRKMAATSIPAVARQCYLSALNSSGGALSRPEVNDTLTAGGLAYTVTEVSELSPAGTDIFYTLTIEASQ